MALAAVVHLPCARIECRAAPSLGSPAESRLARSGAANRIRADWRALPGADSRLFAKLRRGDMIDGMSRIARIAAMMLCSLGAMAMSACMTLPTSSSSSISGFSYGAGLPPTSFSSTSGYLSNGASSSSYSSSSATAAAAPTAYGANDPADGGTVPPGYTNDTARSGRLTSYLQSHRLPLVGAQVLNNSSGNQQVILYGFVATDFGRQDAVDKARRYLHNPDAPVINRISVRPELASGASGSGAPPPSGTSGSSGSSGNELGSVQSYQDQQQQAQQQQQYMQSSQPSPSALSAIVPLIGMMGLLSMGGSSFGMGSSGSYGYPPSYGSPYGGMPYGSPYSPYGGTPYGSYGSPYGAAPYAPSYGYPGAFP